MVWLKDPFKFSEPPTELDSTRMPMLLSDINVFVKVVSVVPM